MTAIWYLVEPHFAAIMVWAGGVIAAGCLLLLSLRPAPSASSPARSFHVEAMADEAKEPQPQSGRRLRIARLAKALTVEEDQEAERPIEAQSHHLRFLLNPGWRVASTGAQPPIYKRRGRAIRLWIGLVVNVP
jgi:hypothetical protein